MAMCEEGRNSSLALRPPSPSHCWALTWRTIGPVEDYWAHSGGLLAEWALPPWAECFHLLSLSLSLSLSRSRSRSRSYISKEFINNGIYNGQIKLVNNNIDKG